MGLLEFVAKIIIFIVSAVCLLLSLAILGLMVYAIVGVNLMEIIKVLGSSSLETTIYSLFGFLGLIIIVSILGVFGVCYKSKLLLGIYSVILMICLIGTAVIATLWFLQGSYVIDNAKEQMMDSLEFEYVNEYDKGAVSVAWNLIQVQLKSCGVNGKDDWKNSTWFEGSPEIQGITQNFPATCCKDADKQISYSKIADGKVSEDSFEKSFLETCYGATDNGSGSYTIDENAVQVNSQGSVQKVKDLIAQSIYIVAGIAVGIVLLQVVLLWAGCRLVNSASFGDDD